MPVEPSVSAAAPAAVGSSSDPADPLRDLTSLFARAIRRLGQSGHVEEASRLAGKAYVLLRVPAPESAEHVNGVMHYLARLPQADPEDKDTTMSDPQLDVRSEPHGRRHELILTKYHELAAGDGFVLVNDHDPKPLYYQFDAHSRASSPGTTSSRARRCGRSRIGRSAA